MLNEKEVAIECLFLDPNNPRFIRDLNISQVVPDELLESKQEDTLRLFAKTTPHSDDDVTNIKDLYDSMTTIGFVPIDRVVVRPLRNNRGKYLVIEGNRRIATIKKILNDFLNQVEPFDRLEKRRTLEPFMDSYKNITCMLLPTDGLSETELAHKISVVLGLRHHGSLLEWDPLPKAYNIYQTYMDIEPKVPQFEFNSKKRNGVASRLSISATDVTSALKTYVAYLQLRQNYTVRDKHYSLIQAGVTNKHLVGSFLKIDDKTFQLDESSLEHMNTACQFGIRDNMPEGKRKILSDPKSFALLGKLFEMQKKAAVQSIKSYATDLINRAIDDDDRDMPLEDAVDLLTDFINSSQWIKAINTELEKQEKELKLDDYTGLGNERGNKDALKKTFEPLKRMLAL